MSAASVTKSYREVARPSTRTKAIAILVTLALAALALYAVYAPPAKVHVSGAAPTKVAPQPAPATPAGEPEREGGERGD